MKSKGFILGESQKLCFTFEDIQRFKDLIENIPQDVVELWKESMRETPDLKIRGELAGFIKTLDYAFLPKLINEIRMSHCKAHYHRAANRVLTAAHEDDYRKSFVSSFKK